MTPDTLQIDRQLLEQLQHDPRYAYAVEEDKPSLFSELMMKIGRWLSSHVSTDIDMNVVYVICGLVMLVLLWWLWRSGLVRSLLLKGQGAYVTLEEAEANIHAVDFPAEIARALQDKDYTRAARLRYLLTLKQLADGGLIDWQPQKTPTQYARDYMPGGAATAAFGRLTNHFLLIRYGGYEADEALYDSMSQLADESLPAQKGGEA